MLHDLTKRESAVLGMRFGIDMKDEYTFEEIGQRFNVIKQRAHQLEGKAMRKLRYPDRAAKLRDFL